MSNLDVDGTRIGVLGDFAPGHRPGEFERVRDGLQGIADRIDPGGALGSGDVSERGRGHHIKAIKENAKPAGRRLAKRRG